MEQSKIDMFMSGYGDKFPKSKTQLIKNCLEGADDRHFALIQSLPYKKPIVMFFVSFFLGWIGVDRFLLGQTGLGIAKIFLGWLGIWWLYDFLTTPGRVKKHNFQLLMQSVG